MLKGINKINKYLNTWLKDNGFECTVDIGLDFGYREESDVIEYCFVIPEKDNILFNKVCRELNENVPNCDPFIISFFHELGHFETQGIFTDKEWDNYFSICEKLRSTKNPSEKDLLKYYYNPIEAEATTWAIEYINNNESKIEKWWSELQPLILNFYKLNKVKNI